MLLVKFKQNIKKILAYFPGIPKKYFCTVCESKVTYFLPCGIKADIFEKKEIVGGGYRKNACCPICGANDRMRFLDYVLRKYTDIYTNPSNYVLHFAPEKCIEVKIRKTNGGG